MFPISSLNLIHIVELDCVYQLHSIARRTLILLMVDLWIWHAHCHGYQGLHLIRWSLSCWPCVLWYNKWQCDFGIIPIPNSNQISSIRMFPFQYNMISPGFIFQGFFNILLRKQAMIRLNLAHYFYVSFNGGSSCSYRSKPSVTHQYSLGFLYLGGSLSCPNSTYYGSS